MATVEVYKTVWGGGQETWRADRWDANGVCLAQGMSWSTRQQAIDDVCAKGDEIVDGETEQRPDD